MGHAGKFYLFVTVFLAVAVVVGGVVLALNHSKNQPVEIDLSQTGTPELSGEVYIGGAVANPGIYPVREGDTLQDILLDAGIEAGADLSDIKIYIPAEGEGQPPQKVDINRAEPWLLQALPDIGKTRAKAIEDYREENGPFKRIEDLLQVEGIGEGTFEKIRDYITVSD
ncbi:MAG: ComEA family DNA-binding protein [Dehalococcoidia bacterium]|nr:ComEA family DNA-binding protein [Dehalococcoidia bacterium]